MLQSIPCAKKKKPEIYTTPVYSNPNLCAAARCYFLFLGEPAEQFRGEFYYNLL